MKKISQLTQKEIIDCATWEAWKDKGDEIWVKPAPETKDFEYGWYVSHTEYTLSDGTKLNGFVIDSYQKSHHMVFVNGAQFSPGDWDLVTPEEAESFSKSVKLPIERIYPINYLAKLKYLGNTIHGCLYTEST